jgi:hypothetical protein
MAKGKRAGRNELNLRNSSWATCLYQLISQGHAERSTHRATTYAALLYDITIVNPFKPKIRASKRLHHFG